MRAPDAVAEMAWRQGLRLPDRVRLLLARACLPDAMSTADQPAGKAALLAAREAFREDGWVRVHA